MQEIPLSRPDITERERRLVEMVLRSGRLALGPMAERFEELVARRTGRRRAVACSSGTAGLHMTLVAMGVGPGDEVIVPSFCFVAPANAVLYVGATPIFVDSCPKSLNMDPVRVEAAVTDRTKAIVAVENFGNPQHMDVYRRIADKYEIKLIEDACEGLGATYKGRAVGSFGHAAVFGFYPNKQITTGEGGMVVTDDDSLADLLQSLRNQGRPAGSMRKPSGAPRSPAEPLPGAMGGKSTMTEAESPSLLANTGSWMEFARLGYNYRLSEINAALGVAQMERLDEILQRRQEVAEWYIQRFLDHSELVLPSYDDDTAMSWFVFVVRLSDRYAGDERDRIIAGMHRHDVGAAAYFPCVHLQPQFRALGYEEGRFPITERVSQRTIALPFYTKLEREDAEFAARTLELMIERENLKKRA